MRIFSESKYRKSMKDLATTKPQSKAKINPNLIKQCKGQIMQLGQYCIGRDGRKYAVAWTWCEEVDEDD